MYNALDIAKYVILTESENGNLVTNLRLQKLLYFLYVYVLCVKNKKLFHESIYAWTFGPVVPTVYHEFLIYGLCDISIQNNFSKYCIAEDIRGCIDMCLEKSHRYSTGDLIDIFRSQTIWEEAYRNPFSQIITDKAIIEYYNNGDENV